MCEKIEARFVRGNAFKFQIDVVAYTESGRRVENFELGEAVLKCGNKTPLTVKPYEVVDGTTILVPFDGNETLGIYGMEMTGTFEGEAWRWAYRKVFQIVETNEAAHLPEGCIVLKDTLFMTAEVVVGGVGAQVQADWLESDPVSPAFIKNKPNVYVKPSGGIPKSDLSSSVQTSLNKANSALQDAFGVVDAGTLTKTLNQYTIAQSVYNSVNAIMNAGKMVIVTAHLDDDNRDVACVMAKKGSDYDGCDVRGNVSVNVHLTPLGGWAAYKELQDVLVSGTNIKTVNGNSLLGSGDVSVGTYILPRGGIPSTDLANGVQTSLGKADTALQPSDMVALTNNEIDTIWNTAMS